LEDRLNVPLEDHQENGHNTIFPNEILEKTPHKYQLSHSYNIVFLQDRYHVALILLYFHKY
jgi:hypothetical protein